MEKELREFFETPALELLNDSDVHFILETYLCAENRKKRNRSYKGTLNLENMTDDEIVLNFRFKKEHLLRLKSALGIPDVMQVTKRGRVSGITALCVLLRRLVYPNRLCDLEAMFGLSSSYLSFIINHTIEFIEKRHGHLLNDLQSLKWLNHEKLIEYCKAISSQGSPLNTCWGLIDGTARRICRPSIDQESYFSGHKRFHCVKYQSVLSPDGIIVSLMGAFKGKRHDAGIYRESGTEQQLKLKTPTNQRAQFVIYGDPAYPISDVLLCPFRGARLTQHQHQFNSTMSKVRLSVEWGFAKVISEFAFCDFHKNQKLLLQEVSGSYKVATILTNCHTCLYGSPTAQYFQLTPPLLEEYLGEM